jgi:S-DNA-T family DNA segregation ATPase FtsK/SpoIIIE
MAAKKSTAKKTSTRTVTAKRKKMDQKLRDTLISVLLVGIGIFMFLSLITNLIGIVGEGIRSLTLGFFGLGGFIVPPILVFAGIQIIFNKKKLKSRLIVASFFLLMVSALFNTIRFDVPARPDGVVFANYFVDLTESLYLQGPALTSGGLIGGYLAVPLTVLCSKVGAIIILSVIILLTVIFVGKFTYESLFVL